MQAKDIFFMQKFCKSFENEAQAQADLLQRERVANSPLGIYSKSDSAHTGLRLARYTLLRKAQELLPKHSVSYCLRCRIDKDKNVGVKYNEKREKAHYSNLVRCGSVWACPNCAPKITEKRKQEIKKAIDSHKGGLYMLTLTFPHKLGDNLKKLITSLELALKRFFGGRKAQKVFQGMGKIGHIKALEITHGRNGWHPHYHILIFTEQHLPDNYDTKPLLEIWRNACRLAGLGMPSEKHGLDFRKGDYSRYITKWGQWGADSELTKSHIKKGSRGNLTAWDILKLSAMGNQEQQEYFGKLFQEFALSFKGRRQLVWSRGLKAMFGIGEVSDEQLADETDKDALDVWDLNRQLWYLIRKFKRQADFLTCVEYDQKHDTRTAEELLFMLAKFQAQRLFQSALDEADFERAKRTAAA